MNFSVRLISLKCLVSQEAEGDELYITLNGDRVWAVQGDYKMHQQPSRPHQIKEVDFVEGRWLLPDGWLPMPQFEASAFVFADLTEPGRIEVWDHDNFSRDDYFGRLLFSENEAGHGNITGVAARDGAHYVLTYRVETA